MLYDEIKEKLKGIKFGWEICQGCEFLVDQGDKVRCQNRFYFSRFGVHGVISWAKNGKAILMPNCPRKVSFLVFYKDKDFFEKRDINQCKKCAHFRDYRLNEEFLEKRGVQTTADACYGCNWLPQYYNLVAFGKREFAEFGFRGKCQFKPKK